jgi:FolB domain-containing protein
MNGLEQDYIEIKNLGLNISIGVNDWEKHLPQKITLDLKLFLPLNNCKEQLNNTICYAEVSNNIRALFCSSHHNLIETVAEKIADHCLEHYKIDALEIMLKKYHMLPDSEYVAIKITRFKQAK